MMGRLTFVNEDQAQIIAGGILLVDLAERRGEVEASKKQPDRYGLSCKKKGGGGGGQ